MINKSVKEKCKKKKGLLHYIFIGLVILFIIYVLYGVWMIVLRPTIPHTKTNFKSYAAFREKAFDFFPSALPDSASDISYYSYSGNFDECLGVAFTLESKDYPEVISEFENTYKKMNRDKWEKSYTNEVLNGQFSEDKNLSFLQSLAGDNLNGYQIIFYIGSGSDETPSSFGVLGNEKKGRIVAFYVKDAFPEK